MAEAAPAALCSDGLELDEKPCPHKIRRTLTHFENFYSPAECDEIETWIDDTVMRASMGYFAGQHTVDVTPCRTKYFFGTGYTYGRGHRGKEELLPLGAVDAVPEWMRHLVIRPLEERGIVKPGFIDSVVMNDYRAGSSIVAHVDPIKLFARPILTATFFWSARLVFGASFDPQRSQPPVYTQVLRRGSVLKLDGYAANKVTHGIRPEDMTGERRVSIVLRHVSAEALEANSMVLPSSLPTSWGLVCRVQGLWRECPDMTGDVCLGRLFLVRDLAVTVLQPHCSTIVILPTGELNASFCFWQLQPEQEGLICSDALLDNDGVSQRRLQWRKRIELGKLHRFDMQPPTLIWDRIDL